MNEAETIEVAYSYGEIGNNHLKLGNIDKALDMLQISLKIKIEIHGENNFKLASTYNNIGEVYDNQGRLE